MIRKGFLMSVHAGCEAEYARRHQPIWEELEAVLRDHGVRWYSIFLHPETRQLFGCVECRDEAQWNAIASTEVCRRWWQYMKEVMPSNPDGSPVAQELREVFHLEFGGMTSESRNALPPDASRDKGSAQLEIGT
jgi:L-rhamnose mutarotase